MKHSQGRRHFFHIPDSTESSFQAPQNMPHKPMTEVTLFSNVSSCDLYTRDSDNHSAHHTV